MSQIHDAELEKCLSLWVGTLGIMGFAAGCNLREEQAGLLTGDVMTFLDRPDL